MICSLHLQLTIQGIDFVAQGGATNKKEAEAAAAREFLNYLVDNGHLAANSVPPNLLVRVLLANLSCLLNVDQNNSLYAHLSFFFAYKISR